MSAGHASLGHAVVSGSSSGIGLAITQRLLADGWRVTGLDIAVPSLVHPAFRAIALDLADRNGDGSGSRAVIAALGPAQALVHAAGVLRVGRLGDSREASRADDADLMWRLHVVAASRLAEALLPAMAAAGHGRVVLIGSRVARGKAGRGQYAATKAALVSLARSWAAEVVAQGVTVNVVSPAATATAMTADPARAGATPLLPPICRYAD